MAFIEDIRSAWKTGRSLKEIKEARDFFADKEDLEAFFSSGWSIEDVKEFKEMVETKPTLKDEPQPEVRNDTGLEVPENHGMVKPPETMEFSTFKNLGQKENN